MKTNKVTGRVLLAGATLCGGGGILLFAFLMFVGPVALLSLPLSNAGRLGWDALLSLLFFCEHSILIRRTVRKHLTTRIPDHYYVAVYAIISGITLFLFLFLWQPTGEVWFRLEGVLAWLPRMVFMLAVVGIVLVMKMLRAVGALDPLGIHALHAWLSGKRTRPIDLTARGAYRYLRHPLYLLMLVLVWATPTVTSDRLLMIILWTGWIVVATFLEERDLVFQYGAAYREYQRAVPRLIPWQLLVRRQIADAGKPSLPTADTDLVAAAASGSGSE